MRNLILAVGDRQDLAVRLRGVRVTDGTHRARVLRFAPLERRLALDLLQPEVRILCTPQLTRRRALRRLGSFVRLSGCRQRQPARQHQPSGAQRSHAGSTRGEKTHEGTKLLFRLWAGAADP